MGVSVEIHNTGDPALRAEVVLLSTCSRRGQEIGGFRSWDRKGMTDGR